MRLSCVGAGATHWRASRSLTSLLPSWQLALESDNKSPKTIKSYLASVKSLAAFLATSNMPAEIDDVTTESIRAFLVAERERTKPLRRIRLRPC